MAGNPGVGGNTGGGGGGAGGVAAGGNGGTQPLGGQAGGNGGAAGGGAGGAAAGGAGGTMVVNCGAGGFIGTAGSLLSDGGFECPVVSNGGFVSFSVGQQFFGWTVMGAAGHVSPLSGHYASGAYTWPAHGGSQTIDLTGNGANSATGISQAVTTVPGMTYRLSFWVGNMAAPGTSWGATSTVNVLVDGAQVMAATNSAGAGSTAITWQQFTLTIPATMASTTLAFVNGDPSNDNSNLLDDVVFSQEVGAQR